MLILFLRCPFRCDCYAGDNLHITRSPCVQLYLPSIPTHRHERHGVCRHGNVYVYSFYSSRVSWAQSFILCIVVHHLYVSGIPHQHIGCPVYWLCPPFWIWEFMMKGDEVSLFPLAHASISSVSHLLSHLSPHQPIPPFIHPPIHLTIYLFIYFYSSLHFWSREFFRLFILFFS